MKAGLRRNQLDSWAARRCENAYKKRTTAIPEGRYHRKQLQACAIDIRTRAIAASCAATTARVAPKAAEEIRWRARTA
jgi:hypothetical protein